MSSSSKTSAALTPEEERLLHDFSRNVSTKSSLLFYGNALVTTASTFWLFWRIHMLEMSTSLMPFLFTTALAIYFLAMAYRNTKFTLKHKIAVLRGDAVSRSFADDRKMGRREREERILWKKNQVADFEATTLAIFYNNALFVALTIFFSFYVVSALSPNLNYILSLGGVSGLLALLSTGSK